jgi:hypothetical protein
MVRNVRATSQPRATVVDLDVEEAVQPDDLEIVDLVYSRRTPHESINQSLWRRQRPSLLTAHLSAPVVSCTGIQSRRGRTKICRHAAQPRVRCRRARREPHRHMKAGLRVISAASLSNTRADSATASPEHAGISKDVRAFSSESATVCHPTQTPPQSVYDRLCNMFSLGGH